VRVNRSLVYWLSGLLSIAVVIFILMTLDWLTLSALLTRIRWGWLMLAFMIYFINLVFRAMRFRILLYSRKAPLRDLLSISALHNMFVYILPAKSGDVFYILLAKQRLDLPLSEGSATLLAARLYDFAIIALLLAIMLPVAGEQVPATILGISAIFSAMVLGGSILLMYFLRAPWVVLPRPDPVRARLARLIDGWNRLVAGLRLIQRRGGHVPVALLTLGIWSCLYADYYFMALSLGTPITFLQISTIALVMVPLTLLPLQGFANIGTHEIGWTSVLRVFGYSYQEALSIAVGSHFILLVTILIYGGLSLLATRLVTQRRATGDDPQYR